MTTIIIIIIIIIIVILTGIYLRAPFTYWSIRIVLYAII